MTDNTRDKSAKAQILTESLPFMRQYSGHRLVVKFGGNAMVEADTLRNFAQDIVLLHQVGTCPVVVHGGGPPNRRHAQKTQYPIGLRQRAENNRPRYRLGGGDGAIGGDQ